MDVVGGLEAELSPIKNCSFIMRNRPDSQRGHFVSTCPYMEFQFVSSKLLGADLDFLAFNCPIFP